MRFVRIGAIALFLLSLVTYLISDYIYDKNHDLIPPVITCDEKTITLSSSATYEDYVRGLTASDNRDGDLTSQILISSKSHFLEDGSFKVKYVVFDSNNNSSSITRNVILSDYRSPEFKLSQPLYYSLGESARFINQIKADDCIDGDISGKIRIVYSNVSNYREGVYPVKLEVTNSLGDKQAVELSVCVFDSDSFCAVELSEYITYIDAGDSFNPMELVTDCENKDGADIDYSKILINGLLDTQTPGCYQLCYTIDGMPNAKTYLTVVVREVGE